MGWRSIKKVHNDWRTDPVEWPVLHDRVVEVDLDNRISINDALGAKHILQSAELQTSLATLEDERICPIRRLATVEIEQSGKFQKSFEFLPNILSVVGGIFGRPGGTDAVLGNNIEIAAQHSLLRVRPETLCRITEFSEHESNGRELDEGERVAVEVLPVLGQSAAAVEPGDGAFDHPTPGLDDEALHPIGSLDDLGLEIGQDAGQDAVKDRPLIGAVGEQFPEKGKQTEQGRQQRETAVAILNVGGGDDAVQQQALRIDQNMPLLALDQLAGIEAVAVDASPPFSALFTL